MPAIDGVDRGSAGGFIWITAQGIPVKMDLLSKSGGSKSRITMTLRNINIGIQDAQLFEVPADYSAIPGAGMGALSMSKSPFGMAKAIKGRLFQLQSK